MTGSASDPPDWQPHIRNKPRREALAKRFRDAGDSLQMVLVRDMWLTGFDAPSLHTMYVDKPMRGHGLMQAIARVNRVFRDKPGGLVVDYLGLAHELKRAPRDLHGEWRHRADRARPGRSGSGDAGEVRDLLWSVPRVRPLSVDDRHGARTPRAAASGAGAHPRTGERQGPLRSGRAGSLTGIRARRAARRCDPHPRRGGVLPSGAVGSEQARGGRGAARRRAGTCRAPDHLAWRWRRRA